MTQRQWALYVARLNQCGIVTVNGISYPNSYVPLGIEYVQTFA